MSHHFLQFRDVHYRYPNGYEALCGVSFRISHGQKVAVVGANGAGKIDSAASYRRPAAADFRSGRNGRHRRNAQDAACGQTFGRTGVSGSGQPAFHAHGRGGRRFRPLRIWG
ncbi:MAG: hypothetical protein L6V35_06615 [Alistipes putredinis]|nr:MAG: hypothetical protein L6V35_06615 [Alistipes putredinis]